MGVSDMVARIVQGEQLTVHEQMNDDLHKLVNGAASEELHSPPVHVPMQLPKLIELASEKYATNAYNTITGLRAAAHNMQQVAQELLERASQLEDDRNKFPDHLKTVVEYEMHCAELVNRFRLIKPRSP